jgi:carbohydrate binding protein with CBM4/9 domain
MILAISRTGGRVGLIFLGLSFTIWLSYSGIRTAMAAHHVGLNTRAGYERAVRLEPGNAGNWYLLGRHWQYGLDEADAPHDAVLRAQNAYPLSPEVSWRYGNFLLRQNEVPQAYAELHAAVYVEPRRSAEAVSLCWRVDPDLQAILDNVIPRDRDAYLDVIHELTAEQQFAVALAVWSRFVPMHPRLQMLDAIPFTSALIGKRMVADAVRIWDDAIRLSGIPAPPDPPGSVVWDGGFESAVQGGGFAWFLANPSQGFRIALDSKERHSGRRSLRVTFDGRHNLRFQRACHYAPVQPGVPYHFSAWVRTQTLTTDQGVKFRLDWMENSHARSLATAQLLGTQPWTQIQMNWNPGKDVHQVAICVVRKPSTKFDSQMQGAAWFDDVELTPQPASRP